MSDLISRSALIDALKIDRACICSHVFCHVDCDAEEELMVDLVQMINNQPTIEAVPVVQGEWIKNRPNIGVMEEFHRLGIGKEMSVESIYWTCSVCGNWGLPSGNFCSKCGADMRKERSRHAKCI